MMRSAPLTVYAGIASLATALAIRDRHPARLLGFDVPGSVVQQALTVGTGISPPAALIAVSAAVPEEQRLRKLLASLFLAGALAEPVTWRALRRPIDDPLLTAAVVANVVLPIADLTRRSPR
jgi:hypothetical protein